MGQMALSPRRGRGGQRINARQAEFLGAFKLKGNVAGAAAVAGVDRSTPYHWAADNEVFKAAWDEAEQIAIDRLEAEARRRAEEGTVDYVVSQGRIVMIDDPDEPGKKIPLTKRVYSDQLMTLLLKAHRPAKYRERIEHSGDAAAPVTFSLNIAPADSLEDARARQLNGGQMAIEGHAEEVDEDT